MTVKDYETGVTPNWCPGCGNFGLWQALKQAVAELGLDPGEIVIVAGIGCHGHINNFTQVSSFEGLHGRPIPLATGIKSANHDLKVIVSTGDGDCLGEGGNHFIHASRRNHDITVLIHNNASYSLTTGQSSPTSPAGYKSKSTPYGKTEEALNPLALALSAGATFVSRGFVGDVPHLTDLMKAAIQHPGFAVVDILQPCVVFNKEFTFEYYRQRVYKLERTSTERSLALKEVLARNDKIGLGIFYQSKEPSYEEKVQLTKQKALVNQPLKNYNWRKLSNEFY
ncbi:MAG TPA: 2-oxoacid:ferredoxin oxidoreductase subunit beta [Candidatus Bathyarchaeia archaeon]|nr:2-oxoacid:ferredoxin oxidoreductase subunit beta [Candidatus Bathyarchaeia archaeon]